ncbi:hypothetical protein SAMN05216553_101586 [Lentzea fradiae]|uniref:Uncharacterized protein n=1 Tax=Lentzea fradiae TaxID=200378 RepID=A0A1G7L116_9PSEU|nr:hypothetical protein [Lentzea fradiae]SDF42699.1 hypothetical protein SAMN05216553_101586 [Lentzea fradiae]
MGITRRVFVSGAVAAPLVAQLGVTGVAHAAAPGDQRLTALDGLAELRLTDVARTRLADNGIQVQAVAPATPITGADGTTVEGVKLTPEYATGTVTALGQPGQGSGRALGGIVLSNSVARMEMAGMRVLLPEGVVFGFLKVDDDWVGELPLYAADPATMRVDLQAGAPGQPVVVRGNRIQAKPTREGVEAFTDAFGVALFTTDDVVFAAAVQGNAWPLPTLPGV